METDSEYETPEATVVITLEDGACTNCEFDDAEPGGFYFIEAQDIGLATIGGCELSGTAVDSGLIAAIGMVDPYIESGAMNCGALFEIDSEAEFEAVLEMTMTANDVDYDFTVTIREQNSDDETSSGFPLTTILLVVGVAGAGAITFFML